MRSGIPAQSDDQVFVGPAARRAEAIRARMPRSEAELRRLTAFAFWLVAFTFTFALSFVPAIAPEDPGFWRLALGIPTAVVTFAHITVFKRFSYAAQSHLLIGSALLGCAGNFVLLQIMGDTWAVLAMHFATVIWVAYFFSLPVTVSITAVATLVAVSPLVLDNPGMDQPTDASRLIVLVPALWAVAGALHTQKRAVDKAFEQANTLAYVDPLTGLENQRSLTEQFEHFALKHVGEPLALLLIDVDDFKRANTLYGHVGGDHSLRTISNQLRRCARSGHLIARIGGDEFAVLMPGVSGERVELLADFYRAAVVAADSEVDLDGVRLDASVGHAIYPADGETLDDLLTVADRSMYQEKAQHTSRLSAVVDLSPPTPPAWLLPEPAPASEFDSQPAWKPHSRIRRVWFSRPVFARAIALYWAGSSLVISAGSLTPGAEVGEPLAVAVCLVLGFVLAVAIFIAGPSHRGIVHVLTDVGALVGLAAVVAMTGGADSPAVPLIFVYAIFQSWFWGIRAVKGRLLAALLATGVPLLYDPVFFEPGWGVDGSFLLAVCAMTISLTVVLALNISVLLGIRRSARELSLHDPLTGLPNRRAFGERVEAVLAEQHEEDMRRRPAVVMIDLDDFKLVNTELGHHAGDVLLKRIGDHVAIAARDGDLVARIGGDEFAAVLLEAGEDGAKALAERFVAAVADATAELAKASGIHVTASAGYALYPLHGTTLDELIRAADRAMMSVKRGGKSGTAAGRSPTRSARPPAG